jgi:hypothetical protein
MPNAFGQPDDPFSTPDGQAWARAVHDDLVPKLTDSALSVTIYSGRVDVKLAVELGAAILLDKPIVLVVQSGVKVPDRLVRAADKILEADLDDPAATSAKIQAAIGEFGIR